VFLFSNFDEINFETILLKVEDKKVYFNGNQSNTLPLKNVFFKESMFCYHIDILSEHQTVKLVLFFDAFLSTFKYLKPCSNVKWSVASYVFGIDIRAGINQPPAKMSVKKFNKVE